MGACPTRWSSNATCVPSGDGTGNPSTKHYRGGFGAASGEFTPDGRHPNDRGAEVMAEMTAPVIERLMSNKK